MSSKPKFSFEKEDPVYLIRRKLEEYTLESSKETYALILKLLNELFEETHTSLLEFNYCDIDSLILEKSKNIFLKYDVLSKITTEINIFELTHKNITDSIKELLVKINYTIIKKRKSGKYIVKML